MIYVYLCALCFNLNQVLLYCTVPS